MRRQKESRAARASTVYGRRASILSAPTGFEGGREDRAGRDARPSAWRAPRSASRRSERSRARGRGKSAAFPPRLRARSRTDGERDARDGAIVRPGDGIPRDGPPGETFRASLPSRRRTRPARARASCATAGRRRSRRAKKKIRRRTDRGVDPPDVARGRATTSFAPLRHTDVGDDAHRAVPRRRRDERSERFGVVCELQEKEFSVK